MFSESFIIIRIVRPMNYDILYTFYTLCYISIIPSDNDDK